MQSDSEMKYYSDSPMLLYFLHKENTTNKLFNDMTHINVNTIGRFLKLSVLKSISAGFICTTLLIITSCGSRQVPMVINPVNSPAQQDPTQPKMANGEQVLMTFCMDEAYDMPGEYMAGLGIAENCPDRQSAITEANLIALSDIKTRYIGVIKNTIEYYTKDVNVPSGKKIYESKLEGGAQSIGTAVINKYANVVCRKIAQNATGGYVCYVAVHVLLDDARKGLAEELELRKVDYDNKKLFEIFDLELERGIVKQR